MIRPYRSDDASAVLALNAACQPEVGPMDDAKLADLVEWSPYFTVIDVDGAVAGFLIGLDQTAPYTSPNYRWFSERYDDFAYVDRVAVADGHRGAGWGPAIYRHFEDWATTAGHPVLICEVNTEPPNPRSLRFHEIYGFEALEEFAPTGSPDTYRVQMLAKKLGAD